MEKLDNDFTLFGLTIPDPWATLVRLAIIIAVGMIAATILLTILRRLLKKSNHMDDMLNSFVANAVKVACIIILIALCLETLGVSMGTVVAVLGAAGAAIALALKDSLSNVAGGIMIIINKPFKQGDLINVGQYRGRVQSIDLFLTTLRTLNYQIITIPNGLINTSILVNESREETRRVDLQFSISYGSDARLAQKILADVCDAAPLVLKDPAPIIGINRNGDSAVVLDLMAYCRTEDYFDTGYYLNQHVKQAFDENGIEIPYPQMDVHVKEA